MINNNQLDRMRSPANTPFSRIPCPPYLANRKYYVGNDVLRPCFKLDLGDA